MPDQDRLLPNALVQRKVRDGRTSLTLAIALIAGLALAALYVFIPRPANLAAFDPQSMGKREAGDVAALLRQKVRGAGA